MKYHVITLGCQMNLSDSERVRTVLDGAGFEWTDNENEAELLGIIACSVRQKAIDKVYGRIHRITSYNVCYTKLLRVYPPLIFLGIGAMTDFSALISNPKLILIGAAAQLGIFGAYCIALALGFSPSEAGAIGIIGGADGPTAIFLSSKLAPSLVGAIAISAYSYMALVPVIQPPIMKLLTT